MSTHSVHVVCLPHTQTTRGLPWCLCAYTQKWRKLATMLHRLGQRVVLYGEGFQDHGPVRPLWGELAEVDIPTADGGGH